MWWFLSNLWRKRAHPASVQFLFEKLGPGEEALKDRLLPILRADKSVERAYLAAVSFGDGDERGVALCLRHRKKPNLSLIAKASSAFAIIFSSDQRLDVIVLTPGQEQDLQSVCKPFYEASLPEPSNQ